jgi:EAL domain-containing protein (putative c-di-GMP-specific phosphodiesterase class I)
MVKIDGAFITDLEDKPDNQLFIRTLLGLARGFNLTTVAECVETEAEAEILKREGVTYLQGYLYGRPELTRPTNNKIISLVSAQQQKPKLDISSAS